MFLAASPFHTSLAHLRRLTRRPTSFRWLYRSPVVLTDPAHPDGAHHQFSGGFIGGVLPVPIPNTAVKPSRADGTARFPCGRVGRCRNFLRAHRARANVVDAPPSDSTESDRGASLFPPPTATAHRGAAEHAEGLEGIAVMGLAAGPDPVSDPAAPAQNAAMTKTKNSATSAAPRWLSGLLPVKLPVKTSHRRNPPSASRSAAP